MFQTTTDSTGKPIVSAEVQIAVSNATAGRLIMVGGVVILLFFLARHLFNNVL